MILLLLLAGHFQKIPPRFNRHCNAISLLCSLMSVRERIMVVICLSVSNARNILVRCFVCAGSLLLKERSGCRVDLGGGVSPRSSPSTTKTSILSRSSSARGDAGEEEPQDSPTYLE